MNHINKKYHHWCKKFRIKNWKTNKIFTGKSRIKFCIKHKIPPQTFSDILTGKRKFYKNYSLINFDKNILYKYKIKNLKTGKIIQEENLIKLSKKTKISEKILFKLSRTLNYRYKNYSNPEYNNHDSIPIIIDIKTGKREYIYSIASYLKSKKLNKKEFEKQYKKLYYFLKYKRILATDKIKLLGHKNFKYKILNISNMKTYKVLKLNSFARKNKINPYKLYIRNNNFIIKEG